jgi:hypothetical protein
MKFRTGQPKFTRLIIGSALSLAVAMALAGCGGGGGGGGTNNPGGYVITGTAVDSTYPNGVPNAVIEFTPASNTTGEASGEATTSGNGTFSISGLSAGEVGSFTLTPSGLAPLGTGTTITLPSGTGTVSVGTLTFTVVPPPPPVV